MRRRQRFFVLLFLLVLYIASLKAQNALDSQPAIDQNISLAQLRGEDSKAGTTDDQPADEKQQRWSFHVQGTEVIQGQPGFHSPYQGTNSLQPDDNFKQSSSFDLFIGVRLWPGGEFY